MTPTAEIYSLSLHDALPIFEERRRKQSIFLSRATCIASSQELLAMTMGNANGAHILKRSSHSDSIVIASGAKQSIPAPRKKEDRKSTRLNSSHLGSSYAAFC